MKIAIVVHGRFHAFDLAKALLARGHQVTVFTNYPVWAVRPFGLPDHCVRSFLLHGLTARLAERLSPLIGKRLDPFIHQMFGRWVVRQLRQQRWDVVHSFTGVAEEWLLEKDSLTRFAQIVRGSSHIEFQDRLLAEEEQRCSTGIDRPSRWMIDREKREYSMADSVVVLSSFASNSFASGSVPLEKVHVVPLGVDVSRFRATETVIIERCRRIRSGEPLRVLFVGTLSFRKGWLDFQNILDRLSTQQFSFRIVADVTKEVKSSLVRFQSRVEIVPRQPHLTLPGWYAQSDLFLFPTIEDGFAAVLAQANAAGLPILATENCSGSDLVQDGVSGWILPIRNSEAFVERLLWCNENREQVATMVENSYHASMNRDWSDVAADFEALCDSQLEQQGPACL